MTISTTHTYNRAVADGSAVTFNFDFTIFDDADLEVYVGDTLISPSAYTPTIAGDFIGGSVEFAAAPAHGAIVTMKLAMTPNQQTSYPVAGPFPPKTHERALDKLTLLVQQLQTQISGELANSNWLGDWVTATPYTYRDVVRDPTSENWYACQIPHTSGTTFWADNAAGYWQVVIDLADIKLALQESMADVFPTPGPADIGRTLFVESDLTLGFGEPIAGSTVPVGTVCFWNGGYYTGNFNSGFTNVLGNTAAAFNAAFNAVGWYACNGAACNVEASPIWNAAGRYLPQLTDDTFIMGDNAAGLNGGYNSYDHYHATADTILTIAQMPAHRHSPIASIVAGSNDAAHAWSTAEGIYSSDTYSGEYTTALGSAAGGSQPHNHGNTGGSYTGGVQILENRPKFIGMLAIVKVF